MIRVVVIGCGPAGLAAAHAASGLGASVRVLAPKTKTPQHGPLLLQRPIPGINVSHPDGTIHQMVIGGTVLGYRYKLYGDINVGINGDILQPSYHAWRHGPTYDRLWTLYQDIIEDHLVTPEELHMLQEEYDLVVSTASARELCDRNRFATATPHMFEYAPVKITPCCEWPNQPDNTIIFNADPDVPWVRSSKIFGNEVTEWTVEQAPPEARLILKPIWTNCDCYPLVLRTGRFGKWRNETWIDTAYWDTYSAVEGIRRAPEIASIR